jgi:hypothetical protein
MFSTRFYPGSPGKPLADRIFTTGIRRRLPEYVPSKSIPMVVQSSAIIKLRQRDHSVELLLTISQWVVFPLPSPRLLLPPSSVSSSLSRTRLVTPLHSRTSG